jgi:putative endonuclease
MSEFDFIKSSCKKIILGKKGEDIAENYLINQGYQILKRNFRIGHSDIDILARHNKYLVFVEVRTKSKADNGMPEDTLTKKKLRRMKNTAELYIAFNNYEGLARMDAICIILDDYDEIGHLEHYTGVG